MTLVVARVVEGSVRILADWKVTYEDPRRESPLTGVLKAIALSQDTAVAFAGDVEIAIEAIRNAVSVKGADDLDVLGCALMPYTSGGYVDFLTASRGRLNVIREGHIAGNQPAAWLGDGDAFSEYQRFFHEATPPRIGAVAGFSEEYFDATSRMSTAFGQVLEDARFPSVKGFRISLTSRSASGEGFHYLPVAAGYDFQPTAPVSGSQSLLRTTGAEGGGYNYAVLVPEQFGIAAIAAYFLQGRFGALFRPLHPNPVVIVRDVTGDQFEKVIERDHGLGLWGVQWRAPDP